jgi:hypothetical protein
MNLLEFSSRIETSPQVTSRHSRPAIRVVKWFREECRLQSPEIATGQSALSHPFRPRITLIQRVDPWVFHLWTLNDAAERVAVEGRSRVVRW